MEQNWLEEVHTTAELEDIQRLARKKAKAGRRPLFWIFLPGLILAVLLPISSEEVFLPVFLGTVFLEIGIIAYLARQARNGYAIKYQEILSESYSQKIVQTVNSERARANIGSKTCNTVSNFV